MTNETPTIEQTTQAATTELAHQPPLFSEPIAQLGSFTITNSLLTSWLALGVIIVFTVLIFRRLRVVPRRLQNYAELIIDGAINLANSVTGVREKSIQFLPIVFPLFIFILLNNWLGIIPGVGSVGLIEQHQGQAVFVPFLRGGSADLNMTLALSILAVGLTHVFGIIRLKPWAYLNRFFPIELILELPRKIFKEKDYTALLVNPIKFFVGLIELVGEFAKVASLAFRLFGNIFAGEVLLVAMALISAYLLPIPFLFLEILVGVIQALIFAMLTLVFLTVMTTSHEESH